jgi:hypothetical protein
MCGCLDLSLVQIRSKPVLGAISRKPSNRILTLHGDALHWASKSLGEIAPGQLRANDSMVQIPNPKSRIPNPESRIPNPEFQVARAPRGDNYCRSFDDSLGAPAGFDSVVRLSGLPPGVGDRAFGILDSRPTDQTPHSTPSASRRMQPCSHAARQRRSHVAMQPCSHAAIQPCSEAATQPRSHALRSVTQIPRRRCRHHPSFHPPAIPLPSFSSRWRSSFHRRPSPSSFPHPLIHSAADSVPHPHRAIHACSGRLCIVVPHAL